MQSAVKNLRMSTPGQGRILVTGGAGFIGSALVWALNSRGRTDIAIPVTKKGDQRLDHRLDLPAALGLAARDGGLSGERAGRPPVDSPEGLRGRFPCVSITITEQCDERPQVGRVHLRKRRGSSGADPIVPLIPQGLAESCNVLPGREVSNVGWSEQGHDPASFADVTASVCAQDCSIAWTGRGPRQGPQVPSIESHDTKRRVERRL